MSAVLMTGCSHLSDAGDQAAEVLTAPYRADVMICATVATSEKDGLRCIEEVRRAWHPRLEVAE